MKKSEIKQASTQEIIEYLMKTAFLGCVPKSKINIAKAACEELERRGTIESANTLFNVWLG